MSEPAIFEAFPKIARLSRECVITEKIDGTNAQIEIVSGLPERCDPSKMIAVHDDGFAMFAGSRTRYITPTDDNFGFAKWVQAHAAELWTLGEGRHYGEWWGAGIQRNYGLAEKRFSLFNVGRWVDQSAWTSEGLRGPLGEKQQYAPECCRVAPVLYRGPFTTDAIDVAISHLRDRGSYAAPGFMQPEGIIVFHTAASLMFKKTLEGDEQPKGRAA